MKNKIHKESELLEMFCDGTHPRKFFQKPFLNEKYNEVWATDGHILIKIPLERLSEEYETGTLSLPVYSSNKNKKKITLSSLENALSDCPQEEEEIIVEKEKECKECKGTGEVDWEYHDSNGHYHIKGFDCPVCDGSGVSENEVRKKTGRMVISDCSIIKINQAYFRAGYLRVLKMAMEHLEVNVAEITLNGIHDPAQIEIDDLCIIIMPILMNEDMTFHAEIELK